MGPKEPSSRRDDNDSEVDEEEFRDNVDLNDQPKLTVTFKVGVEKIDGIELEDGTLVRVDFLNKKQKAQTDSLMLRSGSATFKQKFAM